MTVRRACCQEMTKCLWSVRISLRKASLDYCAHVEICIQMILRILWSSEITTVYVDIWQYSKVLTVSPVARLIIYKFLGVVNSSNSKILIRCWSTVALVFLFSRALGGAIRLCYCQLYFVFFWFFFHWRFKKTAEWISTKLSTQTADGLKLFETVYQLQVHNPRNTVVPVNNILCLHVTQLNAKYVSIRY